MVNTKDIVVGLSEIGFPILKLISSTKLVVGYDKNPKLMNRKKFNKAKNIESLFMHICFLKIIFPKNKFLNFENFHNQFQKLLHDN